MADAEEDNLAGRLAAQLRALPSASGRQGAQTLEAAFNAASRERVYPGRKGRVPKTTVRTLLGRFATGPDDASAVGAILAALPTVPDNLVSFRELATAVRKVSTAGAPAAARAPSPRRGGSSSYAGTLGRPDVRRAIAKHGTASLPVRGVLAQPSGTDGLGFDALDLGGDAGGDAGGGVYDAPPSPRRRASPSPPRRRSPGRSPGPGARSSPPPAAAARGRAADASASPQQQRERAWGGADASDAQQFIAVDPTLLATGGAEGDSAALSDPEAVARRVAGLEQLTAAQRRALDAMATDRAGLEAALGTAQLRFTAELDARRSAEAAAAAAADALAAERVKLEAARAAWSTFLASAEGASALAEKLQAWRARAAAAAEELVAQRALAEDAAHELEGAAGRVAYECACEREALLAAHAAEAAEAERQLTRASAQLARAAAQQAYELERMRAAAEAAAGVAADALFSTDARKRDIEGVNDALVSLSERLYVGSLSIGALGVSSGGEDGGGGGGARVQASSRDDEVAFRRNGGAGGGNGGAGGGNGNAGGGMITQPLPPRPAGAEGTLQWGLAGPPARQGGGGGGVGKQSQSQSQQQQQQRARGGAGGATPPLRRDASPSRRAPPRRHWAAANAASAVTRPRGRAPAQTTS